MKPTFLNIFLYFLIKYVVFYVIMMFKNDIFYFVNPKIRDGEDLFYYLWMFGFLPVACMILFSVPLFYAFRSKTILFIILTILVFTGEYFIYIFGSSQKYFQDVNGLINLIVSVVIFCLCFFKSIKIVFAK